jgi:hypothetical protein
MNWRFKSAESLTKEQRETGVSYLLDFVLPVYADVSVGKVDLEYIVGCEAKFSQYQSRS